MEPTLISFFKKKFQGMDFSVKFGFLTFSLTLLPCVAGLECEQDDRRRCDQGDRAQAGKQAAARPGGDEVLDRTGGGRKIRFRLR